jgi:predicted small integral membrane protein
MLRLIKVAMIASCALFALLVAFNNIVDYGTNYAFVVHTLSMDTTFPGNALQGRAVAAGWMYDAAYWLIIGTEAATGVLLSLGALRLFCLRHAPARDFNAGKPLALAGAALGFLLWFTGFMVIGGEWFAMWQSRTWNGQEAAFRFYLTLLGVMLFVNQPDHDAEERGP